MYIDDNTFIYFKGVKRSNYPSQNIRIIQAKSV